MNHSKAKIALSKFSEGYNCAQSVTYAFADETGVDKDTLLAVSTGFGAGLGRKQEVCGVVTGAIMVLGAKYGRKENEPKEKTEAMYVEVRKFVDEFIREKGTVRCSELLHGCVLATETGQKLFKEKNLIEICNGCVSLACNILEKHLDAISPKHDLKEMVKQRYNDLAMLKGADLKKCCCNPAAPSRKIFTIMSEDYTKLKGYEPDADFGVGCGLPTQYAGLKKGDTVVDLGSGAGNDCFIAREEVGETGRIIGIDFAPQMLAKARANAERRGFVNVEFLEGDIENMPLPDATADVIVSNCVLNLLPRKDKIFNEVYRVLKPGGHFCISDVVLNGFFPKEFTDNASMYAGCIASAIQREDYLGEIEKAGFTDIRVERTKNVVIPDEVLQEHLDEATIQKYKAGNVGIYSITVTGFRH